MAFVLMMIIIDVQIVVYMSVKVAAFCSYPLARQFSNNKLELTLLISPLTQVIIINELIFVIFILYINY